VVFVTLSGDARHAFVGDLVWQLQMSAIATRYPQITIVPSHDPRGYASILEWRLSSSAGFMGRR
jgi:hypothetical protein